MYGFLFSILNGSLQQGEALVQVNCLIEAARPPCSIPAAVQASRGFLGVQGNIRNNLMSAFTEI